MNVQGVSKIASILARDEELSKIRQGALLRNLKIQKREYYRILRTIRSFDNKTPLR